MTETRLQVADLANKLEANTLITNQVKHDTGEIVSLLKGFKVLASVAKWLTAIVAAAALIVGFFKGFYIGGGMHK